MKTISTLNSILEKKQVICQAYENNECSAKRRRLTKSRFEEVDSEVYQSFVELRRKGGEISGLDLMNKASEVAEKYKLQNTDLMSFKSFSHSVSTRKKIILCNWN